MLTVISYYMPVYYLVFPRRLSVLKTEGPILLRDPRGTSCNAEIPYKEANLSMFAKYCFIANKSPLKKKKNLLIATLYQNVFWSQSAFCSLPERMTALNSLSIAAVRRGRKWHGLSFVWQKFWITSNAFSNQAFASFSAELHLHLNWDTCQSWCWTP